MNYSVLQVSNYFCILWAVLWNGVIISYTQEEAVILHLSIKERKDSKSLKSSWMYIDWLNEKRFSNFRASFCPFHIFISFYLKVASSHVTYFILCILFMKISAWINEISIPAIFCSILLSLRGLITKLYYHYPYLFSFSNLI